LENAIEIVEHFVVPNAPDTIAEAG